MAFGLPIQYCGNRPVACKDSGMQLERITHDVMTGVLWLLHQYIKFNGSMTTKCFKILTVRSVYGIVYINEW